MKKIGAVLSQDETVAQRVVGIEDELVPGGDEGRHVVEPDADDPAVHDPGPGPYQPGRGVDAELGLGFPGSSG